MKTWSFFGKQSGRDIYKSETNEKMKKQNLSIIAILAAYMLAWYFVYAIADLLLTKI